MKERFRRAETVVPGRYTATLWTKTEKQNEDYFKDLDKREKSQS